MKQKHSGRLSYFQNLQKHVFHKKFSHLTFKDLLNIGKHNSIKMDWFSDSNALLSFLCK
jgi:hypothetical protein